MTAMPQRTVFVAVDGSTQSLRAIPLARTLAAQLHTALAAVYVSALPLDDEAARRAARLDTAQLRRLPLRVLTGDAGEAIVSTLSEPGSELLVLTSVAAGDPDRALGTVAQRIATDAPCPIVALRPEIGSTPESSAVPLSRLLVPLDGSLVTAWALRPATALARQLGARIDVLVIGVPAHAAAEAPGSMAQPRYVDQPQHEWSAWVKELKERLLVECAGFSPSADIDVYLRTGDPGAEITRFAREGHYDAVVLVRRSRLEPQRAHTLRAVLHESPCPVVIVGVTE